MRDFKTGRYRRIDMRMHGDSKYRKLSPCPPCGQGLWWALLAGRQTGIIPGLCSIGEAAFAEQLRWPLEAFREAFREVFREGMAEADWEAHLVWVPNAVKYNPPASPNVILSWRDAWDELPECELKTRAYQYLKAYVESLSKPYQEAFSQAISDPSKPSGKPSDMASEKPSGNPSVKASGKPSGNQDQDQDQDQEHTKNAGVRVAAEAEKTQAQIQIPPLTVFVEAWNSAKLLPCEARSTLRANWQVRILDPDWSARWQEAVKRLGRSSRARGEVSDWRATPDWFLKTTEAVARTLAGEFDDLGGDKPEPAQPKTYRPEDNPQYVNTMNAKPCPAEILTRKAK
jgi:hypothetical protein